MSMRRARTVTSIGPSNPRQIASLLKGSGTARTSSPLTNRAARAARAAVVLDSNSGLCCHGRYAARPPSVGTASGLYREDLVLRWIPGCPSQEPRAAERQISAGNQPYGGSLACAGRSGGRVGRECVVVRPWNTIAFQRNRHSHASISNGSALLAGWGARFL